MKKIIINGKFLTQRITGVQRYAREIIAELDKIVKPDEVEMAVPPETQDIPDYKNISVRKVGRFHNILWEHTSFPFYVMKCSGVSLNLCNASPLLSPGIVCIHDAKIKNRPQDYNRSFVLFYSISFANAFSRASRIITVSEFSKKELCMYYKADPKRITVIPSAWSHYQRVSYDEGTLDKYHLKKGEYFFSLGLISDTNKNFRWSAEAARQNPEYTFAVAGGINTRVFADRFGFDVPDNMKILGYVSDSEVKTLMRDCRAFLFPTFYEGFGLPPLEAIGAGCRSVVVSDTEVMHELFGDAVTFVDPFKPILPSLAEIKPDDRDRILKRFTWQKNAAMLKDLLEHIE